MAYGSRKELRHIIDQLEEQGWKLSLTGGNHYKCVSPTGKVVFMPSTPGEGRSLKNMKAQLRRAGAKLK